MHEVSLFSHGQCPTLSDMYQDRGFVISPTIFTCKAPCSPILHTEIWGVKVELDIWSNGSIYLHVTFEKASAAKMATITTLLLSPVLIAISIPLASFAVITTTLAFSTLLVRVAVVYIELGAVVLHDHISGRPTSNIGLPPPRAAAVGTGSLNGRRKSRRSSAGSGRSEASATSLRLPENDVPGSFSGLGAHRDFEGVGGWVFGATNEDDELWTSMNSRLELPAAVGERKRKHQRSMTSGSLPVAILESRFRRVLQSPDFSSNSPIRPRARTPNAPRSSSPVEYFAAQHVSKSTTALDTANMGRPLAHHKTSSSSTLSSGSSGRTLGVRNPGE